MSDPPIGRWRLLDDIILQAVLDAIEQTGSKAMAARQLGIGARTVYRVLEKGFSDGTPFRLEADGDLTSVRIEGQPVQQSD